MTAQAVTGKKLRFTSASTDTVFVFQDGTAADATADQKFDNAFRDGAIVSGSGTPAGSAFRLHLSGLKLRSSHSGREFEFRVNDFTNWNQLGINPGSLVEFWCDQGTDYAAADFPSWHSAEQGADDVKHFHGFIETVERVNSTDGTSEFAVKCFDAMSRLDDIPFMQSKGASRDIDIPYVVVNVEDTRDPEWHLALKRFDDAASGAANKYGTGNPKDIENALLTLGEILDYIQDAYSTELAARGIIADAADDLFDSTELSSLNIKPQKTVFENVGLGTAIRRLIENTLLDHAPIYDPRTQKIRIRGVHRDLITGPGTTIDSKITATILSVLDTSVVSTSGDGSRVRIQSASDPNLSVIANVTAVNAGTFRITIDEVLPTALGVNGDKVLPLYATENSVPFITLGGTGVESQQLSDDLEGVYTAVQITSRQRKTERVVVSSAADSTVGDFKLSGLWDTDIDDDYNPIAHGDRFSDAGVDGDGIEVLELSTWDDAGTTKTRVYFSEVQSAYQADHRESIGASNISEWDGTAFHLLSADGQAVDVSARKIVATVKRFVHDGWADAPTNTIKRFRVDLDSLVNATILDDVNDGDPDLFELSSSEIYSPTKVNGRSAIGRYFRIENTGGGTDARDITTSGCPPSMRMAYRRDLSHIIGNPADFGPLQQSQGGNSGTVNGSFAGLDAQNAAAGFNPSANPFAAATVFRIGPKPTIQASPYQQCLPVKPIIPRVQIAEVEKVTNEVLTVRYPASGFSGLANEWYSHSKLLTISTDAFVDESQEGQFTSIAEAIWRRVSGPHWSGDLNLSGTQSWLGLADLGVRVALGSGDTGYASGAVTEQGRFWGLLQTIEYDFDNAATVVNFDSNFRDLIAQGMLERLFVSDTAEMKEARARIQALEQREACRNAQVPPPSPLNRDGCTVSHQGISISAKITPLDPKQEAIGWGSTSISIAGGGSINPGNLYGTHTFHPQWIVERDYSGNAFAIENMTGAIYGGTESGSAFAVDIDTPATPTTLPGHTADTVDEVTEGFWGMDLETPGQSVDAVTTTGSTTTVIQLQGTPLTNDGRFDDGFVEFRNVGVPEARPQYTISSHTGSAITISPAMSESAPVEGMPLKVWPKRLAPLDATDFPNGGRPLKDNVGNQFVLEGGTLTAAELSSGVLIEDTSSPPTPTFDLGFDGATHEARGTFDFTGATLEGLDQLASDDFTWTNGVGLRLQKKAKSASEAGIVADASGVYMEQASTSNAGAMSATDKTRLESVQSYSWYWRPDGRISSAFNTSGTLGNRDATIANSGYDAIAVDLWEDSKEEGQGFQWPVPVEIDTTQPVECIAWFRLSGTTGSTAIEIEWEGRAVGDNESLTGGSTFSGAVVKSLSGYASGDLISVDLGEFIAASTLAAGDIALGAIYRDAQAGNADDTFTGSIQIVAIQWTGSRWA